MASGKFELFRGLGLSVKSTCVAVGCVDVCVFCVGCGGGQNAQSKTHRATRNPEERTFYVPRTDATMGPVRRMQPNLRAATSWRRVFAGPSSGFRSAWAFEGFGPFGFGGGSGFRVWPSIEL